MSWRAVATVLAIVFTIVLIQQTLAGPLVTTTDSLTNVSTNTSTEHYDAEQLAPGYLDAWFWMGPIAIAGLIGWMVVSVARRELTRRYQ